MKNEHIAETALFIYNYLTAIYTQSTFDQVHDQNIVWGYTTIEHPICVARGIAIDPGADYPGMLADEIARRIASRITLVTTAYRDKQSLPIDRLQFTRLHTKTVFQHLSGSGYAADYQLKYGKSLNQLKKLFNREGTEILQSYFGSSYSDESLFYLAKKSLLGIEVIYRGGRDLPIGIVILLPLKETVIMEFLFGQGYAPNEGDLDQLSTFVIEQNGFSSEFTLVIADHEKTEPNPANMTKVCEIHYNQFVKHNPHCVPMKQYPEKNAVLKTADSYFRSSEVMKLMGLPQHPDLAKNWDGLAAFQQITSNPDIRQEDPILDAGGEYYSAILHQLALCGYTNLDCLNLAYTTPRIIGNIRYKKGDITRSGYRQGHFAAITCLSVIEHGVDLRSFFSEMSRLLRPNGLLFVSTDYWHEPINTAGKEAYHVPIKIFTPGEIKKAIEIARSFELELAATLDLECDQQVITFEGLHYTFIYLSFIKGGSRKFMLD